MRASPLLALPSLQPGIPLAVASTAQACANAALCRCLIASGAVREDDLPEGEADPLKACQHAIGAWIKRQIGPLHCLQPRFAINVLDEHGNHPATRDGRQTTYAQLDVYWCEYHECEWPVGRSLEALNEAMPHLGSTVLQVLRQQGRHVYPLFTPDIADDVASYVYWQGEMDEEAALDIMCEDSDDADREAMREEMVTRSMLDNAYPEWARRWPVQPDKSAGRRRSGPAWRQCNLRRAAKTLNDSHQRQIAADALALSRLSLTDDFHPDIEGEYIGFGAVLSWEEGDVTTRIYDDLLNLAHQGVVPGTDLLHGGAIGHRHVALADAALAIDVEVRGLEQRRQRCRAALALHGPYPPDVAGGGEDQPRLRHRLAALAPAKCLGLFRAHAEGQMPACRWYPPHQQIALEVQHRLGQKAAMGRTLEQGRSQFPRRLGGHGPARADHRSAVHGHDLMHRGQRAARAPVVQQHRLIQLHHVVRGRVDGKLRLVHGDTSCIESVSVAQGVDQAVDQRDGLEALAHAQEPHLQRAGVVQRDEDLPHAVAVFGLRRPHPVVERGRPGNEEHGAAERHGPARPVRHEQRL